MVSLYSAGSAGNGTTSTTTITSPLIDNSNNTYDLICNLPATNTWLYCVIIEYTIAESY
ncbi:MAG: hypothetical protein GY869_20875 [Planctomycetes bacterium]|nr:hypothetical protein [Planctomycetota bacterium]